MLDYSDLDELLNDLSLEQLVMYAKDKQLSEFLANNFYEAEAEKVEYILKQLSKEIISEGQFLYKLTEILDVDYAKLSTASPKDMVTSLKLDRQEVLYSDIADGVYVHDQKALNDALKEGNRKIVLCDNEFRIPMTVPNISYYGIGNPVVNADTCSLFNFSECSISLENVTLYTGQKIVENIREIDILKNVALMEFNNFVNIYNPDYKNFCRLALGRSPFTSKEEYANLCDKLPDIPVGTVIFHEVDYDDEQGKFVLNPKFSMRFYDLLYDVTAGKIFYLDANIEEAKDLFYKQRKQQIFAVVGVSSDGNGLQVKTLFLKTILGNKVIYTIEKPIEKTVTSNSSSSGGLGYGLKLIKVYQQICGGADDESIPYI